MRTGVSVYIGSGAERNRAIIARARRAKVSFAFTSLHVPEDDDARCRGDARDLLATLADAGIASVVDVGPDTCRKLGVARLEELSALGVTHVRLDYGFSAERTVALARTFRIVANASTLTRDDVGAWRAAGADPSRFAACHNYYPKRWTGLALESVRRRNAWLAARGFEVMAFVPGDGELRGPVFEGLPTVEEQRDRRDDVALNMLELGIGVDCDDVLVGDVDLSARSWERLGQLSAGFVDVRCELVESYMYLFGQVHHDRPDSSAHVFRSQESRGSLRPDQTIGPDATAGLPRPFGSIAVSNTGYARYAAELEIARRPLPGDRRMNVVGQVIAEDLRLLPFVRDGFGLRLVAGFEA